MTSICLCAGARRAGRRQRLRIPRADARHRHRQRAHRVRQRLCRQPVGEPRKPGAGAQAARVPARPLRFRGSPGGQAALRAPDGRRDRGDRGDARRRRCARRAGRGVRRRSGGAPARRARWPRGPARPGSRADRRTPGARAPAEIRVKLAFTKMQGAGNDFVVLDYTRQPFGLSREQLRRIADRHLGVGCDQILVVERPRAAGADFRYRIFNADGGEVEQCGNGARCFVKFVHGRGLTTKPEITVETLGGTIRPRLEADGEVSVDMGRPVYSGAEKLDVDGEQVQVAIVSMGNPHAVQVVADAARAPVTTQGPLIERHARFAQGVNAGYMQVRDAHRIALRVWERGAGETLSCGTGACAAVVAGVSERRLGSPVRVETRGGALTIAWAGGDNAVLMKGPAETVFDGTLEIREP